MRLELQDVEWKNFLSYGNVKQSIEFTEGINLILGRDTGIGRSNGAGKSSLIETIPFAWFGKLSRPVKKDQIVNWKNRKQCEVKLNFKKGDNTYTIVRAIKPDILQIFENGSLIPIPSDVRTYQKQLENEILGIDYNTFMYLFYTNLNNNIPLLKMNTAQKRTFLERMFLLDTFTDLNTLSNEKIKGLEDKIFKTGVSSQQGEIKIKELTSQNDSLRLKLVDITPFEKDLANVTKEYEKKVMSTDISKIDTLTDEIEKINTDIEKNNQSLKEVETEISVLEISNRSLEKRVAELSNQAKERNVKIKDIEERLSEYGDVSVSNIEEEIEKINNTNADLSITKLNLLEQKTKLIESRKHLQKSYDDLKNGTCPTCGNKITKDTLHNKYEKQLESLSKQIGLLNEQYDEIIINIQNNIVTCNRLKTGLSDGVEKQRQKDKLITTLHTLQEMKIPSFELEKTTIKDNIVKIKEFTTKQNHYKILLEDKKNLLSKHKESLDKCNDDIQEIKRLETKIENLKKELELRRSNTNEIKTIIADNDEKIKDIQKEIKKTSGTINKLKELVDYLSYLKILCKDENVKQYAISSYMSYLVQQTNHYLSSAGSIHYVKFNKWLEEEIHGPGVYDASYGNLSGGEARSIDLAIQFAFLDVAKLKTGIFPDVLLLDEILDSSIDGGGLANILKIIQTKQKEDRSKTFIITHRTEITDMDADSVYVVSKNNGFSTIEKQ